MVIVDLWIVVYLQILYRFFPVKMQQISTNISSLRDYYWNKGGSKNSNNKHQMTNKFQKNTDLALFWSLRFMRSILRICDLFFAYGS